MNWNNSGCVLLLGLIATSLTPLMADIETKASVTYLVDSEAYAQTPKYLGVNVEVMLHHDTSNLWDWLADSGAKMARVFHPDKEMRKVVCPEALNIIKTKQQFEAFRTRLLSDPENMIPWDQYRFDEDIAWLGIPDGIIHKTMECGVKPIVSIGYAPQYSPHKTSNFPRPLVAKGEGDITDEQIDWGAAASAYEYYLAHFYRFSCRFGVTHYLMMNEPWAKPHFLRQIGTLARIARMALEDVRECLEDSQTAAALWLSGPACHHGWEDIWKPAEPYLDSADLHVYDFAPRMLQRKMMRGVIRTRHTGKKYAMSEFNRIGMRMQPDQSTQCFFPALELGEMLMVVLSGTPVNHPGFEFALLYQFQAPATHRSFKSLIYGDTNYIDWSVVDKALRDRGSPWYPDYQSLQLRFPTPSYHLFKMMARCTPGADQSVESYRVLALGESVRGFTPARDHLHMQNISYRHYPNKFYACQGVGPQVYTLAVKTDRQLIFLILNSGPTPANGIGFNMELFQDEYSTGVVREMSLKYFDQALRQFHVQNNGFIVDAPPESLTQVILTKENLGNVTDLKLVEMTYTPGTVEDLKEFQTTRLRAMGKIDNRWIDLSELNVVWTSSTSEVVRVYQSGLIQRLRPSQEETTICVKTLTGIEAKPLILPGNKKTF